MNQFDPVSFLMGDEGFDLHRKRQQAVSNLLSGQLSASDYLEMIEFFEVDIDDYMSEVLPVIDLFVSSNRLTQII